MISGPSTRSTSTCPRVGWPGSSVRTVRFNKGTIRMLFVTEPNRLKVLAGKILALTTSIAIRKRLINHAPAEEHLFGAPVEDRLPGTDYGRRSCPVGELRGHRSLRKYAAWWS
jgi:hypothetical protein